MSGDAFKRFQDVVKHRTGLDPMDPALPCPPCPTCGAARRWKPSGRMDDHVCASVVAQAAIKEVEIERPQRVRRDMFGERDDD